MLLLVRRLQVGDQTGKRTRSTPLGFVCRAGVAAANSSKGPEATADGGFADLVARWASGSVGIANSGPLGDPVEQGPLLLRAANAQRRAVVRLRNSGRAGSALAERLDTAIKLYAMTAVDDSANVTNAGNG